MGRQVNAIYGTADCRSFDPRPEPSPRDPFERDFGIDELFAEAQSEAERAALLRAEEEVRRGRTLAELLELRIADLAKAGMRITELEDLVGILHRGLRQAEDDNVAFSEADTVSIAPHGNSELELTVHHMNTQLDRLRGTVKQELKTTSRDLARYQKLALAAWVGLIAFIFSTITVLSTNGLL